jgi:UDP-glucose 4-epimerase
VEKLVYASTSGIYPSTSAEPMIEEGGPLSPNSSYSIAKRYNEIYLQSVFQEKGLSSFSLRYFNVYGPRQDSRMVIPRFFASALAEKEIEVYGDGSQSRDFTFVRDAVEATVRVAERAAGCEIINVASGVEHSVLDVARSVIQVTRSVSPIKLVAPPVGRAAYEVQRRCGDNTKLKRLTAYEVQMPLEQGLEETLRSERVQARAHEV